LPASLLVCWFVLRYSHTTTTLAVAIVPCSNAQPAPVACTLNSIGCLCSPAADAPFSCTDYDSSTGNYLQACLFNNGDMAISGDSMPENSFGCLMNASGYYSFDNSGSNSAWLSQCVVVGGFCDVPSGICCDQTSIGCSGKLPCPPAVAKCPTQPTYIECPRRLNFATAGCYCSLQGSCVTDFGGNPFSYHGNGTVADYYHTAGCQPKFSEYTIIDGDGSFTAFW
jgi:hypothetical protein